MYALIHAWNQHPPTIYGYGRNVPFGIFCGRNVLGRNVRGRNVLHSYLLHKEANFAKSQQAIAFEKKKKIE